jgi:hypothetical protein
VSTGAQSLLLSLAAAALAGCVAVDSSFGHAPGAAALGAVRPGVTTRAELIALLGPPEEYAGPGADRGLRAHDPQELRVLEERDLFGRQVLSWVRERRSDRAFIVPILFTHWTTTHRTERVTALLDDRGVVTALGVEPAEEP